MEVKKIKKILTAIGNPILNNELKKINGLTVVNNDIQYQEGIFETLEIDDEIDFILMSQIIPGDLELEDVVEKIEKINSNIKIILILENYDENLEKILEKKGVYRIFYDNKVEIKDIIKIINEDSKMEKYNEEIKREIDELKEYIKMNNNLYENKLENNKKQKKNKINNKKEKKIKKKINNKIKEKIIKNKLLNFIFYKNNKRKQILEKIINKENNENNENKVISILGNSGSGKSIFSVMLAKSIKKQFKKILIIDFDILNNSLHTILGVKKYSEEIKKIIEKNNYKNNEINIENLIIKINNKIDLISGINLIFDANNKISNEKIKEIIEKLKIYYDVIIIDTTSECFFDYTKEIIKISNKSIYLTEANLIEISKSKRMLEMYYTNWNIEKNKINIIFNKFNKKCIDISLLKNLYSDYNILGFLKLKNNYSELINNNFKNISIKNNILKKYNFIWKKI